LLNVKLLVHHVTSRLYSYEVKVWVASAMENFSAE